MFSDGWTIGQLVGNDPPRPHTQASTAQILEYSTHKRQHIRTLDTGVMFMTVVPWFFFTRFTNNDGCENFSIQYVKHSELRLARADSWNGTLGRLLFYDIESA